MKVLKAMAWIAGVLLAIGLILHLTVVEVWTVPGDDGDMATSIEPTLSAGELILLTRSKGAAHGDLVRCPDPQAPGRFVIARVKGLAGEEIVIKKGRVGTDGKESQSHRGCPPVTIEDPRTREPVELVCGEEESGSGTYHVLLPRQNDVTKAHVDKDRVFLVSDNRDMHVDSREYGQIDPSACQKAVMRLWGAGGFSDGKRRFNFVW
jgi:signal peptidase I